MAVRNQDFYDLNESRPYPLSDEATGVDDAGLRLPSNLIADLHLAYPLAAGRRAMFGAVTITRKIATVTFLATETPASVSSFVPLASVCLAKPIDPHRMYPLDALFPGAGGWIVFGSTAADDNPDAEEYTGKFLTAAQSILLPSTAKAYEDLPVSSIARLGNVTALTGLVRLLGGNDIEVVKECREIPANLPELGTPACDPLLSRVREVIVVRLIETPPGTEDPRNLFNIYRGPCAGRPESNSCGDPAPIEFLASVPPDCCGDITVRLRGCTKLTEITQEAHVDPNTQAVLSTKSTCGVIIDCDLGLTEACVTPDRLPAGDGTLPNEATDLCESETSITLPDPPPPTPEESETLSIIEESESAASDPTLPYCNDFETIDPDIVVRLGRFDFVDIGAGDDVWSTEGAGVGITTKNISTWNFDFDPRYKRVSAQFEMRTSSIGVLHNGGVIANYRETSSGSGLFSYYFAEIDWDSAINGFKLFRIGFFNGVEASNEFTVAVPTLALDERYDLCFSIFADEVTPTSAWLFAQLTGVDDPLIDVAIGPLSKANFGTFSGQFGMTSNRAATRFHDFCVENTTDPPQIGCGSEPSP